MTTQAFSISVGIAGIGASASISLVGGATYTFTPSTGTELDPYVDPDGQFTQRNIRCTAPGLTDFFAYYRPDVSGGREEWVFELGNLARTNVPIQSIVASGNNLIIITTTVQHLRSTGFNCVLGGLSRTTVNATTGALQSTSIGQSVITVTSPTQFTIALDGSLGVAKTSTAAVGMWDLGAYTTTITRANGTVIPPSVDTNPPFHYQYSRWRWKSADRPIRKTYAQLKASKFVMNMSLTGWTFGSLYVVRPYTPMAYSGVSVTMGAGGDYWAIGFIPAHFARYLMAPTPTLEAAMRNIAEASGTFVWHQRDLNTGAPVDLEQYPLMTFYPSDPNRLAWTHKNDPDGGHFPSMTWLPWLLTGDPYYLEEHQFAYTHMELRRPTTSRIGSEQNGGRYWSWPLRHCAQAIVGAPATVPSWLLPVAYWNRRLDLHYTYSQQKQQDTTDTWNTVFRGVWRNDSDDAGEGMWMHGFILLVAAWIGWSLNQQRWKDFSAWMVVSEIARTTTSTDPTFWPRFESTPYYIEVAQWASLAQPVGALDTLLHLQYPSTFTIGQTFNIDRTSEVFTLLAKSPDGLTYTVSRTSTTRTYPAHGASDSAGNLHGRHFNTFREVVEQDTLRRPGKWDPPASGLDVNKYHDITYPSYEASAMAMVLQAGISSSETGLLAANYAWLVNAVKSITTSTTEGGPLALTRENWTVTPTP